jgi:bacteriorhodopsin
MNNLINSAYASIGLQLTTGLIESEGLKVKLKEEDLILQDILLMELIVQAIEFIFYIYLVYRIVNNHISSSITSHRYIDWAISTPVMLISFIMFFKYLKDKSRNIRIVDSIIEEKDNIIKVVIANAIMLILGFLSEISFIPKYAGITLGFLPFAYVFKIIYSNYAKFNNLSLIIYYASFFIWGLYGVSAVFPFHLKNTFYNILDLFSKNAYGLFIYFYIKNKSI